MLKLYNTLTHKKEPFEPRESGKVRMYVCGITAYDECHLGHARAAVVFDVVYRYLKFLKYDVTYIRNFTDVDDKIIKKSADTGQSCEAITAKYIQSYQEQMTRLRVLAPTEEPRATQHIKEMVGLIERLIANGLAYASGSDVFFEVRKFRGYGKLSHKKIDDLESGARVEIDEKKKDPLDFALWKGAKPGEPEWDSPWGKGRPGWHIECSAMSMKYLGERFDIHGGGRDLMFPHHENEMAQSEGVTGKAPFAKYWLHNGFVNINAEKMSKSIGNIRSMPAILAQWDPEIVRYFLLSNHYASPLDFTDESMTNAREALRRFYETLNRFYQTPDGAETPALPLAETEKVFQTSLDDDFNTAALVGGLFDQIRILNKFLDEGRRPTAAAKKELVAGLQRISAVVAIFDADPAEFLQKQKDQGIQKLALSEKQINDFITERKQARLAKNWQRSDEIRDTLASHNVVLKDNPDGTTGWEIKIA